MEYALPTLALPRKVRFANPRLNRLHYVVMLSLFGSRLWFILSYPETYTASVALQVQPSFYGVWDRIIDTSQRAFTTHPQLCPDQQPTVIQNFSWPGIPGTLQYTGSCKLLCGTNISLQYGNQDGSCVNYLDILPTPLDRHQYSFRTSFLARAPWLKGSVGPHIEEVWLPEAAEFSLKFNYNYKFLENLPILADSFDLLGKFYLPWPTLAGRHAKEGNPETTKTIILDKTGNQFRLFEAHKMISLTLAEVLSVAKGSVDEVLLMSAVGSIDEPISQSPRYYLNFSEDHFGIDGTLPQWVYHFGARIEADFGCYVTRWDMINDGGLNRQSPLTASLSSPICLVQFRLVSPSFYEDPNVAAYEFTVASGITMGSNRIFSASNMFTTFIETIIFVGLSKLFMRFFMLRCLGNLSRLYRKSLESWFDERTQIATLALRLIGSSQTFQELVDVYDQDSDACLMSLQKIYNRLRVVFSRRTEMDKEEIDRVARFCCKEVTTVHSKSEILFGQADTATRPSEKGDCISIAEYIFACSHNDIISLQHATGLFDRLKQRGFLERFFTPMAITATLHSELEPKLSDSEFESYGFDLQKRSFSRYAEEFMQSHTAGGGLEEVFTELGSLKADVHATRKEAIALKAEVQSERELRCALEARLELMATEAKQAFDKVDKLDGLVNELRESKAVHTGLGLYESISDPHKKMQSLSHIDEAFKPRLASVEQRIDAVEASLLYQIDLISWDMMANRFKDRLEKLEQELRSSFAGAAHAQVQEMLGLHFPGLERTASGRDMQVGLYASVGQLTPSALPSGTLFPQTKTIGQRSADV